MIQSNSILFGYIILLDCNDKLINTQFNGRCLFGRSKKADIRIQLGNVASRHCFMTIDEDGSCLLQNLCSLPFKTLVNGIELDNAQVIKLHDGDIISIYDRRFQWKSLGNKISSMCDQGYGINASQNIIKNCTPIIGRSANSENDCIGNGSARENSTPVKSGSFENDWNEESPDGKVLMKCSNKKLPEKIFGRISHKFQESLNLNVCNDEARIQKQNKAFSSLPTSARKFLRSSHKKPGVDVGANKSPYSFEEQLEAFGVESENDLDTSVDDISKSIDSLSLKHTIDNEAHTKGSHTFFESPVASSERSYDQYAAHWTYSDYEEEEEDIESISCCSHSECSCHSESSLEQDSLSNERLCGSTEGLLGMFLGKREKEVEVGNGNAPIELLPQNRESDNESSISVDMSSEETDQGMATGKAKNQSANNEEPLVAAISEPDITSLVEAESDSIDRDTARSDNLLIEESDVMKKEELSQTDLLEHVDDKEADYRQVTFGNYVNEFLQTPTKPKKTNTQPMSTLRRSARQQKKIEIEEQEIVTNIKEITDIQKRLEKLKVVDLRAILASHQKPTLGRKAELVERIVDFFESSLSEIQSRILREINEANGEVLTKEPIDQKLGEETRHLEHETHKNCQRCMIVIPERLKVAELKACLLSRGIEAKGRKQELIEALKDCLVLEEQAREDQSIDGQRFIKSDHPMLWKSVAKCKSDTVVFAMVVGYVKSFEANSKEIFRIRFLNGETEDLSYSELQKAIELYSHQKN